MATVSVTTLSKNHNFVTYKQHLLDSSVTACLTPLSEASTSLLASSRTASRSKGVKQTRMRQTLVSIRVHDDRVPVTFGYGTSSTIRLYNKSNIDIGSSAEDQDDSNLCYVLSRHISFYFDLVRRTWAIRSHMPALPAPCQVEAQSGDLRTIINKDEMVDGFQPGTYVLRLGAAQSWQLVVFEGNGSNGSSLTNKLLLPSPGASPVHTPIRPSRSRVTEALIDCEVVDASIPSLALDPKEKDRQIDVITPLRRIRLPPNSDVLFQTKGMLVVKKTLAGSTWVQKIARTTPKGLVSAYQIENERLIHEKKFCSELVMADKRRQNVITMLKDDTDGVLSTPYINLEYVPGQQLAAHRDAEGYGDMGSDMVVLLVREFPHVLQFLVEQGVEHNDIKPQNIIVWPGNFKLIDFGLATFDEGRTQAERSGSPAYTPLETADGFPLPTTIAGKRDIYAFGVTMLFALGMLKLPHGREWKIRLSSARGKDRNTMLTWIKEIQKLAQKVPKGYSIIKAMVQAAPSDRIGPKDLVAAVKTHFNGLKRRPGRKVAN